MTFSDAKRIYLTHPTTFGLLLAAFILWSLLLISEQSFFIFKEEVRNERAIAVKCTYFGGLRTNSAIRMFLSQEDRDRFSCPTTKFVWDTLLPK